MDQKQCVFVPRVVIVPVGGTVEFLNSDRLLHNVRGGGKEIPLSTARNHARTIAIGFKSPEVLRVDCDLHSWMRGWIVVAEHPFYAVTNEEVSSSLKTYRPASTSFRPGRKCWAAPTRKSLWPAKALRPSPCAWRRSDLQPLPRQLRNHGNFFDASQAAE